MMDSVDFPAPKEFRYEVKAPDRVWWIFSGYGGVYPADMDGYSHWRVYVTQEGAEDGIGFDMATMFGNVPTLMEVYSAFLHEVPALLGPIGWDIHKGKAGME